MEGFLLGLAIGSFFVGIVSLAAGDTLGRDAVMQQAFDRGYAVQCLGERGYHWECE